MVKRERGDIRGTRGLLPGMPCGVANGGLSRENLVDACRGSTRTREDDNEIGNVDY